MGTGLDGRDTRGRDRVRLKPGGDDPRFNRIAAELRRRILTGAWAPGARLPTRAMIETEYRASSATVQKAIDILLHEGLVQARRRVGTVVAEPECHRRRYGLIFPLPRARIESSRFLDAIRREAEGETSAAQSFHIAYEIDGHADSPMYRQLVGLVRQHRLAGLILATPAGYIQTSPLLQEPHMARVAVLGSSPTDCIPRVALQPFDARALAWLRAAGRRRLAVLRGPVPQGDDAGVSRVLKTARQHGLACRPYWIQDVHLELRTAAARAAQLLFHHGQRERPDALLITDDNLVEHATRGLCELGLRIPRDVTIVAHANFPWPTPSAVPVRRVGYDIARMLRECLAVLEAQRRGEKPAAVTLLPAVFDDELRMNTAVTIPEPEIDES